MEQSTSFICSCFTFSALADSASKEYDFCNKSSFIPMTVKNAYLRTYLPMVSDIQTRAGILGARNRKTKGCTATAGILMKSSSLCCIESALPPSRQNRRRNWPCSIYLRLSRSRRYTPKSSLCRTCSIFQSRRSSHIRLKPDRKASKTQTELNPKTVEAEIESFSGFYARHSKFVISVEICIEDGDQA
jgi:hypothetical protein